MRRSLIWMVLSGLMAASAASAETPAVIWWSAPVEPGELVQVHGGTWGTNPVVEVVALGDRSPGSPQAPGAPDFRKAERVHPVKVTETGVCFERPRDLPGALAAGRIVSDSGAASEPFVLNEPAVWWCEGDRGAEASPGGWLRFFGRCLSRDGKARAVLTRGARRVELNLSKRDVWSLDTTLPADLPAGPYEAFVHNGGGGKDGWRSAGPVVIAAAREVWKADRFDVTAYGAVPNDGMDDTLALQAALAAAATNGGGTVYLPRGRFQCNGTLEIPVCTLLRGESRETTELYWPDCDEPPEALIEGIRDFGIEDLFIHSGKYRNGIVCKTALVEPKDPESGRNVTIRRLRLKLLIDQYLIRNTAEIEKRSYLKGNALVIQDGRFVRVEDCDLYASKEGSTTLYFILEAEHLHIANCRINGSGWAVVGGDRVIFENNEAWNCTYSIAPVCRNLYWGRNRQHDLFTNNRESITHDGARTAFRGLVPARCDGTRLELDFGGPTPAYTRGADYWVGRDVQLVEGRGAGQTRTLLALSNNAVIVDRPWSIAPDATSRFVVAAERRHLLYVDNYTEDSSIAIQLYGGLTEGVLARNRCARSGGFVGFGMDYHGIIPLWFVQYLDNRILEGNGYRGPSNEVPPRDSVMEFRDHGGTNTLTRSCVIRRGVLHNNAHLGMAAANGLVENCVVSNADLGVSLARKDAGSVILRGNRFENVAEPLDPVALQQAVLHPCERALAMIAGAEASMGHPAPAAWNELKAELARTSSRLGIADPAATAIAQDGMLKAVRTLSAACGTNTLDARVARSLLGASVRTQDWDPGMTRLLTSEAATTASITFHAALAATAPPAACRVVFNEAPGWAFQSEPVRLAPGATADLKTDISAPAGPKGFFLLPATVEYVGDGWTLSFRDHLPTLTENRITQWIVAGPFECATNTPFDARSRVPDNPVNLRTVFDTRLGKQGWQALTNANVHGALAFSDLFGTNAQHATAVALSVLRVARPTTVRLAAYGSPALFMDGKRLGSDLPRCAWGSVSLAPGLHVLKAVVPAPEKKAAWQLRVYGEVAETCAPGDLVVLPAAEVLRMESLVP